MRWDELTWVVPIRIFDLLWGECRSQWCLSLSHGPDVCAPACKEGVWGGDDQRLSGVLRLSGFYLAQREYSKA